MRRRTVLAVFALLVGTVVPATVTGPAGARVAGSGVQVQLLTPGTNPREPLRLTPPATPVGRTLTFSFKVAQSGISSLTVGPLQMRIAISSTIGPAGPGGTIRVPFTYGGFELLDTSAGTPEQLDAVRTALARVQGLSGEFTLSSTGAVLSNRLQIPSTVDATLRGLLQQLSSQANQLSVPLPTRAVGTGARWRATTQLVAGGIRVHQTYDYSLRSRDGSRLTLDIGYTQTAGRQRVAFPGLPSGVTVEVTGYHIAGRGTMVLDLSQVIPLDAHLAAQGRQEFRVHQGRQSGSLNQDLQLGIDLAPR